MTPMNAHEPPGPSYPARSKRQTMVADLVPDEETWIAGRLLPRAGGALSLRDASGSVAVRLVPPCGAASAGDIVDLLGTFQGDLFTARDTIRLAKGHPAPAEDSANAALWRLGAEPFERRASVYRAVRDFFGSRGFLEVETPCILPAGGQEPHLDPFKTRVRTREGEKDAFLITSPEYCHKRLLAAGCEKIFEIARVFRNGPEEGGGLHWYEFAMLEWYRAYASYLEIMADVENLVAFTARAVESAEAPRLEPPFERITMAQAFDDLAGIDLVPYLEGRGEEFAADDALSGRFGLSADDSADARFFKIIVGAIEPGLRDRGAVFIVDYPATQASLSKVNEDDPLVSERFELYVNGVELANGFSELNDPVEQERRFRAEACEKEACRLDPVPRDLAFLEALQLGMPPAGGVALGLDRLAMVLFGETDLHPLLPFRTESWK